jgi:hypothetical protein
MAVTGLAGPGLRRTPMRAGPPSHSLRGCPYDDWRGGRPVPEVAALGAAGDRPLPREPDARGPAVLTGHSLVLDADCLLAQGAEAEISEVVGHGTPDHVEAVATGDGDLTLGFDLRVAGASTDEVYTAMDWLVARQDEIEATLAGLYRSKNGEALPDLRVHGVVQAVRWHSLITPPSTFRRRTGAPSGTTTGAS